MWYRFSLLPAALGLMGLLFLFLSDCNRGALALPGFNSKADVGVPLSSDAIDFTSAVDVARYIDWRHDSLSRLARDNPTQVLPARVSFYQFLSAAQFEQAMLPQIRIEALYDGSDRSHSGRYMLGGQSLSDALAELARQKQEQFTNLRLMGEEAIKNGRLSVQDKMAYERFLISLNTEIEALRSGGILFYGLDIEGQLADLEALTNLDFIRLVDLTDGRGPFLSPLAPGFDR